VSPERRSGQHARLSLLSSLDTPCISTSITTAACSHEIMNISCLTDACLLELLPEVHLHLGRCCLRHLLALLPKKVQVLLLLGRHLLVSFIGAQLQVGVLAALQFSPQPHTEEREMHLHAFNSTSGAIAKKRGSMRRLWPTLPGLPTTPFASTPARRQMHSGDWSSTLWPHLVGLVAADRRQDGQHHEQRQRR